jgi:hypothetical protein
MTPFDEDYLNPQLPNWQDIGGTQQTQQQPAQQGSFVDALKKRLSHPQMKQGAEGAAAGKAAVSGGASGGGMGASL